LDAALTARQSLGFRVKPQKQRLCTHCRRGCSAKREIILDEAGFVQNFIIYTLEFTAYKDAARFREAERAAPMLKNNSAEGSLFW